MDETDSHDLRITPARGDLAARYLEGKVQAARFVSGQIFEICAAIAPVCDHPSQDASLLTQALRGERVTIYDRNSEGWAWGQLVSDGYVGWLPEAALGPAGVIPTHKVTALRTFGFPGPSIKLPPAATLPMAAMVVIARHEGGFAVTPDRLFVPAQHLGIRDGLENDFVVVAERFVGTPYLWGGKTSLGIDCSGLLQIALSACGVGCPRDSDMQQASLGQDVPVSGTDSLQRGDLLFWKGHVAIARDATTIVHANAHHMATAIEPTRDAIARIKAAGGGLSAIKRI